jgi:enoyl-CoA hydratase/carnithine racemase
MSPALVHLERRGPVAVVRLEAGKVNALSAAVLTELADVVDGLAEDLPGALVVTGGDRVFAAGADIAEFASSESTARLIAAFRRAFDAVEHFPRVTIAAIAGYALGGGLELALACDLRIGSSKATVGLPEIQLGLIPGAGGTQRLPRLIGVAPARRMMLTGRHVSADEALALGILDEVVLPEELATRAEELAAGFAAGPLVAQSLLKQVIREGADLPLPAALDQEQAAFLQVSGTEDARIGVDSFLQHGPGKATFTGR